MAFSLITSQVSAGPGPTTAINTTGADLLFVGFNGFGGPTPLDSAANAWGTGIVTNFTSGRATSTLWRVQNPTTNAAHTFSMSSGGNGSFIVAAFSGSLASGSLDQTSSALFGPGATTEQAGSITTAFNGALYLMFNGVDDPANTGTPKFQYGPGTVIQSFDVIPGATFGCVMGWTVQSTAGALNPTMTRSNAIAASRGDQALMATFRPAASVSAANANWLVMGRRRGKR